MQEPGSHDPDPPEEFTISACTQIVLKRWSAVEQLDTEEAVSWHQTAADKLSRFRLWASNLGAYHDPRDKRSADYRVRTAPDVRTRIIQLAQELSQYLDETLDILSGRREGAVDDEVPAQDNEEYDGAQSEISELWLMIDDAVDSLMGVSVFIRAKANNNRNRFVRAALKSGKSGSDLPDTSYDKAHVRQKHPKLEQIEWLVDRLGAANTQRRQFLVYAQAHQSRIAYDESGIFASKSIFSRPTQAVTQATTHAPSSTVAGPSDRLDYYETTDAESNLSATTVGFCQDDDTLDVIPLHRVCKKGKAGICPYCQGAVMFTRRKAWRQHVFRDLMAYSCTFEHCDAGLFESRVAWKNHENAEHRRDWRCPSCRRDFGTRVSVAQHVSVEHPATEDGLVYALITAASPQHASAKVSDCPFCDDYHARPDSIHPGPVTIQHEHSWYDLSVSIDIYQRHLGRHMEQLALFAVPSVAADDDDDEEDDNDTHDSDDDDNDDDETLAVQHPPCNTLHIGNLPADASEDELKAIFAKQRGYKRLCFRTKSSGPMCSVEFEDTSYATAALHELYGQLLHNSVEGGIRLSYSKNPLGVRSGQPRGMVSNDGHSAAEDDIVASSEEDEDDYDEDVVDQSSQFVEDSTDLARDLPSLHTMKSDHSFREADGLTPPIQSSTPTFEEQELLTPPWRPNSRFRRMKAKEAERAGGGHSE